MADDAGRGSSSTPPVELLGELDRAARALARVEAAGVELRLAVGSGEVRVLVDGVPLGPRVFFERLYAAS